MQKNNLPPILSRIINESPGNVSALVWEWGAATPLFSHQPDRQVVSASTIKVPILLAALDKLDLDTPVFIGQEKILEDSQVFEQGPGEYTVDECCRWMIITSDNTATNALIDLVGMEAINAAMRSMGLSQTVLMRRMLDYEAIAAGKNNFTSARDMLTVYKAIEDQTILTPALCSYAKEVLLGQRCKNLLFRYIPATVEAAHKTGELESVFHDAGIIYQSTSKYFIGVFVTDVKSEVEAGRCIGSIAKHVFNYF